MLLRFCGVLAVCGALAPAQTVKGWQPGKGYGWIWGAGDETGALNAIAGPDRVLRALREIKTGKVYDLGVRVDRLSYKWPGHSPVEVMSYRSPAGVRLDEKPAFPNNPAGLGWHSCALFISDNVGTQIDSLGHITAGDDAHWYNGYQERSHGGDFGLLKADADTIPPVIARGVLIDVPAIKGVDALESNCPIGPKEMMLALARQRVDVEPGDVVLIRTGVGRFWGETGAGHEIIARHDSAGLSLEGAKWLVEEKGAVLIAADNSSLEVATTREAIPVHRYLLVDQGVHIGELHYLEDLARDKVYRFTYIAVTNRIKGATAGFALRPLAIR
jgi:kynurenine formamidase